MIWLASAREGTKLMVEAWTAAILKATGPQDSPLPPGQALAKITQPPGKGAKLGKDSHLLTTL